MARAMRFENRAEAGRLLASLLRSEGYASKSPLVLAPPRGGVPVGYEVAHALRVPLDVFVVRKLGVPGGLKRRPQNALSLGFAPTTRKMVSCSRFRPPNPRQQANPPLHPL